MCESERAKDCVQYREEEEEEVSWRVASSERLCPRVDEI